MKAIQNIERSREQEGSAKEKRNRKRDVSRRQEQ
jgi:hypothetical protein